MKFLGFLNGVGYKQVLRSVYNLALFCIFEFYIE